MKPLSLQELQSKVIVVDDFITQADADLFITEINKQTKDNRKIQAIRKNVEHVHIIRGYKDKFDTIDFDGNTYVDLHEDVTYSKHFKGIGKHIDKKIYGDRWKMLIYLNHVENGGTVFYTSSKSNESIRVENKPLRAVFFDIQLSHSGQNFSNTNNTVKYAIGFRLITK